MEEDDDLVLIEEDEEEDDDCVIIEEETFRVTTDIALVPSKEDMKTALECSVCQTTPLGRIVACSSGHSACESCAESKKRCPRCKASFTQVRCLVLESMVESLKFHCSYQSNGCEKVLHPDELKKHMDSCDYRSKESKRRKISNKQESYVAEANNGS